MVGCGGEGGGGEMEKRGGLCCFKSHNDCLQEAQWNKLNTRLYLLSSNLSMIKGEGGWGADRGKDDFKKAGPSPSQAHFQPENHGE